MSEKKPNNKLRVMIGVVVISTVLLWNDKLTQENYLYILGATAFSYISGVQLP